MRDRNPPQVHLNGVPAKIKLKLMRPKPEEDAPPPTPEKKSDLAFGSLPSVPSLTGGDAAKGDDTSDQADPDYEPPKNLEEPFANTAYVFEVDGVRVDEGQTDGDGCLEVPVMPNARKGRMLVNTGTPDEKIIELDLGTMDPGDEPGGARKRLINLGFLCLPEGPLDREDIQTALRKFQQKNSLEVTGNLDERTQERLEKLHGC